MIDFSKIKHESKSENAKDFDEIKNIFDQIDQLSSSEDGDEEEEKFEVHDLSKSAHLEGIQQSFEEIQNDFKPVQKPMAQSEYITPSLPKLIEEKETDEFYDNNFWNLKQS